MQTNFAPGTVVRDELIEMPRLGCTPSERSPSSRFGVAVPPELLTRCFSKEAAVATAAGATIASLVRQYGVVGFRGGGRLLTSLSDMVALAESLGVVATLRGSTWVRPNGRSRTREVGPQHDVMENDDSDYKDPRVLRVVRESGEDNDEIFGEQWHRDGGWMPQPPVASIFAIRDQPAVGGDTHFACAAALAASLPSDLAAALDSPAALARHSMINTRLLPRGVEKPAGETGSWTLRPPLRRQSPSGGGGDGSPPLLDICDGFTESLHLDGKNEEGDSDPEHESSNSSRSRRALSAALVHVRARAALEGCRWAWEAGDIVVMDNHRCLHRATGGYAGARRELWRVLLSEWHDTPEASAAADAS